MITDICHGIRNSYAFKTVAVGKSGFADTCNRIGNCYIFKAAAFAECTVAYACNGIRNANGCKAARPVKKRAAGGRICAVLTRLYHTAEKVTLGGLRRAVLEGDVEMLVVQRRRWANGGLLIIGKFFRIVHARHQQGNDVKLGEWALRVNYMASIAWSSFGLMFLLAYPFDQRLLSPWVVLASLPYFSTMSSDLKRNGYKRSDIFRIYGFNIVLLTVNLSGTLKSIQQGMTNTKIPFARTPKVNNRTASPALYVTMPWVIIIYSCMVFYADTLSHNWGNAVFAGFNAIVTFWALTAYIGIWHSVQDMVVGLVRWFFVPIKEPQQEAARKKASWRDALYFGDRQMIYESRPL